MSLEKKIEDFEKKLAECDSEWEKAEESIKQQYNQAYGAYVGRRNTLQEVLDTLRETEKNEENQENPDADV